MQNIDSKKLNDLLVQIRRIEEHRTRGAEQAIRRMYKSLLDELRHFLADEFTRFAEDDKLTFIMLQKANEYARFLEEVEQKIDYIEPEVRRQIRSTVEQTYQASYDAMTEGIRETSAGEYLTGISSVTPDIVQAAVDNPISGLTLNDRLQKRRRDVIYDIKQAINVGLINGDGYTTMAKRVSKVVDGDYKKAVRIVRTEVHRVREAGNHDAAERVDTELRENNAGMVMAKTWKTMKDERVRPNHRYKTKSGWKNGKKGKYDHQSMEGVCIAMDEEFTLPSGAKTKAPGQSGVAGEDINCRCYLSYDLVEAEKLKKKVDGCKTDLYENEADLSDKSKYEFVESITIDEAQNYAQQFCNDGFMAKTFKGRVDYKGVSVENANAINRALTDVYNTVDIDKISGIKAISPNSALGKKAFPDGEDAVFSYNPIEHGIFINKDILKNAKSFEKYVKRSEESFNLVMKNIDKLTGREKELALIYKNAGRSLVDGKTIEGMFTHELGHHVQWTLLDARTNNAVGSRMSKYANKISGYANASKSEYLAESFSAYIKGERKLLDPEYVAFMDKKVVAKTSGSGIIKETENKFNTLADPMREVLGSAEESHPNELKMIVEDLTQSNVKITRRDGAMAYMPSVCAGNPGEISIEEGASYSAWLHEYQHFCDDREDGYLGMRVFQDLQKCAKREVDAYQKEINLAKQYSRTDIVERLEKLREKEVSKYE